MKSFTRLALLSSLAITIQAAPVQDSASTSSSDDWSSQQWDVIVVGAGTAGIIVADKLTEAGKNVLLLEQGGDSYGITGGRERPAWLNGTDLSRVDVPGLYSSIFSSPNSSLLCKPQITSGFQGCCIGGSSAINGGLYFQPPASDWDTYFPDGWKNDDIYAAKERLLSRQPWTVYYSQDDQFYLPSGYNAAKKWLVDGAGYADIDINVQADDKTNVFGRTVWDYRYGQRGGPTTTYLQTALGRPNFHLQTGVRVQYVIRDSSNTATGVNVLINNQTSTTVNIAPNGRVVLSCGALQSPQLLMFSGIGPSDSLANLTQANKLPPNTSEIINDAVGDGLFDNPNTFLEISGPTIQAYNYNYSDPIPSDASKWLSIRSGPYSFAGETSAFWSYVTHPDGSKTGLQGTVNSQGYQDFTSNNTFTVNIYGTSGMQSKGRVVLSPAPDFAATTDGKVYYSDGGASGRDAASIATFIYDLFQYLPAAGLTPLNIPQNSTLAEIQTYIATPSAYAVGSVQHWSSSCRIGACVDAQTRVMNMTNLHVIDASIINPLTVNPQFGVMVAAEHGAQLILDLDLNQ